jgi:hypothetical protein
VRWGQGGGEDSNGGRHRPLADSAGLGEERGGGEGEGQGGGCVEYVCEGGGGARDCRGECARRQQQETLTTCSLLRVRWGR